MTHPAPLPDRRSVLTGLALLPVAAAMGSPVAMAAAQPRLRIGLYNNIFKPLRAKTISENEARARRVLDAGMHQFNVVKLQPKQLNAASDFLASMKSMGMEGGLMPAAKLNKNVPAWFDGTAERVLSQYAPLDGQFFDIFLGHEVFEWADRKTRWQIVETSRRALPKTPVRLYYGHLDIPLRNPGAAHPRGGHWTDYTIVDGKEPHYIHFATSHLEGSYEALQRAYDEQHDLLDRVVPGRPKYCHVNFMEETLASADGQQKLRKFVEHLRQRGTAVLLLRSITEEKIRSHISDAGIDYIAKIIAP